MSVLVMIGAAALAEGTSETAKSCFDKAIDVISCKLFQHEQRARRKRRERREFV